MFGPVTFCDVHVLYMLKNGTPDFQKYWFSVLWASQVFTGQLGDPCSFQDDPCSFKYETMSVMYTSKDGHVWITYTLNDVRVTL